MLREAPAVHLPAARRGVTRPVRLTVGTLAATAAATTGFVVFGGGSPAYAVTENSGAVTIEISNASGINGANSALHKLGANVAVVPVRAGCPDIGTFARQVKGGQQTTFGAKLGDSNTITVNASGIPAGYTALAAFAEQSKNFVGAVVLTNAPIPACVSLPTAPPPGAVTGAHGPSAGAGTSTGHQPGPVTDSAGTTSTH